jgi:hypothetical protein
MRNLKRITNFYTLKEFRPLLVKAVTRAKTESEKSLVFGLAARYKVYGADAYLGGRTQKTFSRIVGQGT